METITLKLSSEEQQSLYSRAAELGLQADDLVRRGLQRVLMPTKLSFKEALEYTFNKNAELYRRLA
jgi:hypothetical protein